jgi:4-hydroxy-3-polyprenylbenzoate decarboxylase
VLEGEILPNVLEPEGPFGEYTGYYTEELIKPIPKPALDVKRIYYRNNPILWETSVGRPVGDQHILYAFTRNASLWTDLVKMEIPGIKSVYTLPEASGRFIVVVSVEQMYPGHADQVGAAVIALAAACVCAFLLAERMGSSGGFTLTAITPSTRSPDRPGSGKCSGLRPGNR